MEKEIKVTVRVSNEEHAEIIRDEIQEIVSLRTTVYYVSEAEPASKSIEQIGMEFLEKQGVDVTPLLQ